MVIDASIDYFVAIAEGRLTLPFKQWWDATPHNSKGNCRECSSCV
jgi:hypothetical protein